jgi:N-acetyl-gamma-glutamyl-phosphate reductase
VPEIMKHGRLTRRPIFVPSVGNFRQGMLVSRAAASRHAARQAEGRGAEARCRARYAGSAYVKVVHGVSDPEHQGGRSSPRR